MHIVGYMKQPHAFFIPFIKSPSVDYAKAVSCSWCIFQFEHL